VQPSKAMPQPLLEVANMSEERVEIPIRPVSELCEEPLSGSEK
jgi:hypothetical protein